MVPGLVAVACNSDIKFLRVGHNRIYAPYICTVYMHRIFGDFPAKNIINTPYIYRVGQNRTYSPYIW